ncbi:NAD(P)-binding protein [Hyaloraphidium curvatum]|nr:NAD(P)-binding protein [Hyaloraphidium curvatum]
MAFLSRLASALGFFAPDQSAKEPDAVRIGILGAAEIAPPALIFPALRVPSAKVVAVAARDGARAEKYAAKHGIPKSYASYTALLADPDIDAVYVPSPNGLHYAWTIKALQAGKHVLLEKPLTSNAEEARGLVEAATKHKRVLMEAAHSFHHPAAIRVREIVRSGEIGDVVSIDTAFVAPPFKGGDDIRFNCGGTDAKLAGGAAMDLGSYMCNAARFFTDQKASACTSAQAHEMFPGVDDSMAAELELSKGAKARVECGFVGSMFGKYFFNATATIKGTKGTVTYYNYVAPFVYHYIAVAPEGKPARYEKHYGDGSSTYKYQLEEFVRRVREQKEGGPARTASGGAIDDMVAGMEMIDLIYEKSGLGKRVGYGVDEVK